MPDDATNRLNQFHRLKIPAVLIPPGRDRTASARAGILDPVRIPVEIVTKSARTPTTKPELSDMS